MGGGGDCTIHYINCDSKNIGSHHLPRYTRYRIIAGPVIRGGDCTIHYINFDSTKILMKPDLSGGAKKHFAESTGR